MGAAGARIVKADTPIPAGYQSVGSLSVNQPQRCVSFLPAPTETTVGVYARMFPCQSRIIDVGTRVRLGDITKMIFEVTKIKPPEEDGAALVSPMGALCT